MDSIGLYRTIVNAVKVSDFGFKLGESICNNVPRKFLEWNDQKIRDWFERKLSPHS
jgi:hypothetical protein